MFLLSDGDLAPLDEMVQETDDRPILRLKDLATDRYPVLDDIAKYVPGGDFHIVDSYDNIQDTFGVVTLGRWEHLYLASLGVRAFIDRATESEYSPINAGLPPVDEQKIRKAVADGAFSESRSCYFKSFGVNYIGRTNHDPRNIFVLDNKKGNSLHNNSDETLKTLYKVLPEDWWGSCGFVSAGNINKLEAFLESMPMVVPLAFTTGAFSKLKFMAIDYADVGVPQDNEKWGISVRERANRLSNNIK